MRAWERVGVPSTLCGRCGRELLKGESVLVITRPRGTAKPLRFVRCDRCEGPAPPDLPPLVERDNRITPTPMARLRPTLPLGMTLADYRARQSGEREPGEDDD
jgi:hypothetical protein